MNKVAKGFLCPNCGTKTKTVKSKPTASGVVKRRRACLTCAYRCTTEERRKGTPAAPGHICPEPSVN